MDFIIVGEELQWAKGGDKWILVPFCLMWMIWKERNDHHFDGIESPMHRINPTLHQIINFVERFDTQGSVYSLRRPSFVYGRHSLHTIFVLDCI